MEGIWARMLAPVNTRGRGNHSPDKLKACVAFRRLLHASCFPLFLW